jgi:hypothetical protein
MMPEDINYTDPQISSRRVKYHTVPLSPIMHLVYKNTGISYSGYFRSY